MLESGAARPPNLTTAYWLIEKPGFGRSEVLTVGAETLPVFSSPDEAETFLRLGGFEATGWRTVECAAGELLPRLATYHRAGVSLVALDPLPEMVGSVFDTTIALVTVSLSDFAGRHVTTRSEETFGALRY